MSLQINSNFLVYIVVPYNFKTNWARELCYIPTMATKNWIEKNQPRFLEKSNQIEFLDFMQNRIENRIELSKLKSQKLAASLTSQNGCRRRWHFLSLLLHCSQRQHHMAHSIRLTLLHYSWLCQTVQTDCPDCLNHYQCQHLTTRHGDSRVLW